MTRIWGEDLVGQRFGRLTVIAAAERINAHRRWECKCDCGATVVVRHGALKRGAVKSCGCLRREVTTIRMTSHGQARKGRPSRTYRVWAGMLARCFIPSATGFDRYGAVGVSVCDRWRSFENFLSDMGEAPPGRSIDRIKNELGYEPGNCRWATRQEQNENRRSVRWIEHDGKRMNVVQWAHHLGITKSTLLEALDKYPVAYALRARALQGHDQ